MYICKNVVLQNVHIVLTYEDKKYIFTMFQNAKTAFLICDVHMFIITEK